MGPDLATLFNEINGKHFDGFLDAPVLRWNSRLRSSAGRFMAGRRKFLSVKPPVIEIASYLLKEENSLALIADTLAHEMIHYWLWVRAKAYGHTPEFIKKMKQMGVSRYNPVPRRRPPKYLYRCEACTTEFPARRRLRKNVACAACCNQKNNGKYDSSFRLVMVQSFR
jgi:predicted SprT family Zn-dependent metalloprotease